MAKILTIINELDMNKMFKLIVNLHYKGEITDKQLQTVVEGKNNINIQYYINDEMEEQIQIQGNTVTLIEEEKEINIIKWFEEKQYRETLMINLIEENLTEEDLLTER